MDGEVTPFITRPRSGAEPGKYPKTRAAVRALELDQWKLGDNLIEECGAPGKDGAHNSSSEKLAEAAELIKADGYDYTVASLRMYREIGAIYPPAMRIAGVDWSTHRIVRNPELLVRIVKDLPDKKERTNQKIRKLMATIKAENEAAVKAQEETAQDRETRIAAAAAQLETAQVAEKEALRQVNRARDPVEKAQAEGEYDAAKHDTIVATREKNAAQMPPPPDTITPIPASARIPAIALSSVMTDHVNKAARELKKIADLYEARSDDLHPISADAVMVKLVELQQTLQELTAKLRQSQNKTRSHLAAV